VAVALFATVFSAGAQEQRLSLSSAQMSVSDILLQIRQQTNLGVAYRTDQLKPQRVVTLPSQEISLARAIEVITRGTDTKAEIDGNMIVFLKANPAPIPETSGFKPTPLAEFRESLGLRPLSVMQDGDGRPRETYVEIPQPQESHLLPVEGYYSTQGTLPRYALKMNLLYLAGTFTPNLQFEFGLGRRTSLELSGSYNPWNLKGSLDDNRKFVHMILKPEFRYWFCERFDGHYLGLNAIYARYNIGTYYIPRLFAKAYRYDGYAYGGSISYGYNWAFAKRWGLEFNLGVGVLKMKYDRYSCQACDRNGVPVERTYFGPTNAAISLSFLFK
jgi:hypothetical protein